MVAATFWQESELPEDAIPVQSKKSSKGDGTQRHFKLPVLRTNRETERYFEHRVRFNVLTSQIEIRDRKNKDKWVEHDNESVAGLYLDLSQAINESADKGAVIDTVRKMARANKYNPLVEYFNGLKDTEADT